MPLKLSVGLNKKIGLPNYGSLGASCSVEIELDSHVMARNPALLQQQAQQAFASCTQAVEGELARQTTPGGQSNGSHARGQNGSANGHTNGHSNGHHQNGHRKTNGRQATASQVKAIVAIAGRQRLDLARELRARFQVDRPENLSITDASRLIDELKTGSQKPGGP